MKKLLANKGRASALYDAGDHLLVINGVVDDNYYRLAWRDIEALIVEKTPAGVIVMSVAGALALVFFFITVVVRDEVQAILGGVTAICFAIFLSALIKGGTCHVSLQTATQTRRLRALTHRRSARKVYETLIERIEAAQGVLTEEQLREAKRLARQ